MRGSPRATRFGGYYSLGGLAEGQLRDLSFFDDWQAQCGTGSALVLCCVRGKYTDIAFHAIVRSDQPAGYNPTVDGANYTACDNPDHAGWIRR